MYKYRKAIRTTMKQNIGYSGERLEEKIQRILSNKEPIKDGAPLIYTERKDGIQPAYNIRTDRMEVALDAMDKADKIWKAKRKDRQTIGEKAKEGMKKESDGAQSADGKTPDV